MALDSARTADSVFSAHGQHAQSGNRLAVVYVTDEGYLLPTLLSCAAVRSRLSDTSSAVFVATLDVAPRRLARVDPFLEARGITRLTLDGGRIAGIDTAAFRGSHITPATLGRFLVGPHLPKGYDRILYIDGDTWPVGDLSPLLNLVPAPGTLLAAEDAAYFVQFTGGPSGLRARAYLRGLGLDGHEGYFNAGILSADLPTWNQICAEAFEYYIRNPKLCRYNDQSALNAVAQGRRLRLSPRWNFVAPYLLWDVGTSLAPAVLHFTGAEKPWLGFSEPWLDLCPSYAAEARALGAVLPLPATAPDDVISAYATWFRRRLMKNRTLRFLQTRRMRALLADVHASSVI